jgi:hypothetical protein
MLCDHMALFYKFQYYRHILSVQGRSGVGIQTRDRYEVLCSRYAGRGARL